MRIPVAIFLVIFATTSVGAQDKLVFLNTPDNGDISALWRHVLPRFKLKTGIKVIPDSTKGADVVISPDQGGGIGQRQLMVHANSNQVYFVELVTDNAYAIRFMDWLVSEIGQRTISGFQKDDKQIYYPVRRELSEQNVLKMTGDIVTGEELSIRKCGRCHVISERNKYGGIGSTPSFPALRTLKDWREKYSVFWTLNPHPSFTQIEGVTEPFDPAHPPHIYPILLTSKEVKNIGAYMETIAPADLGAPLMPN